MSIQPSLIKAIHDAHTCDECMAVIDGIQVSEGAEKEKLTFPIHEILCKAVELCKKETNPQRIDRLISKIDALAPQLANSSTMQKTTTVSEVRLVSDNTLREQLVNRKAELEKGQKEVFDSLRTKFKALSEREQTEWEKELGNSDYYLNENEHYTLVRREGVVYKFFLYYIHPFHPEREVFYKYEKSSDFRDEVIFDALSRPFQITNEPSPAVVRCLTHVEMIDLLEAISKQNDTLTPGQKDNCFTGLHFFSSEQKKFEDVLKILPKENLNDIFKTFVSAYCNMNYDFQSTIDLHFDPFFRLIMSLVDYVDLSCLNEDDRNKLSSSAGHIFKALLDAIDYRDSGGNEHHIMQNFLPADRQRLLRTIEILLKLGLKVDVSIESLEPRGGACLPDFTFLERMNAMGRKRDLINEMMIICFKNGAKIHNRLARNMLKGLPMSAPFMPFLVKQGFIAQADAEVLLKGDNAAPTERNCVTQARLLINDLEHNLKVYNSSPQEIPLELISNAKKCKALLKSYIAKNKNDPELHEVYRKLSVLYDAAIAKNPFLRELQSISREIRTLEKDPALKPSRRISRFYSLFGPSESFDATVSMNSVQLVWQKEYRKQLWPKMRDRAVSAAVRVQSSDHLKRRQITWVHGTKSSSLPMITKVKALMAQGQLIERNIPSFSGELAEPPTDNSVPYINATTLSGECLTSDWEDNDIVSCYFNASTRFLVSWLFASKVKGYSEHHGFDAELSWKKVDVNTLLGDMIDSKFGSISYYVPLHVMRLRMTDREADKKLNKLRIFVEAVLKEKWNDSPLKDLPAQQLETLKTTTTNSIFKNRFQKVYNALCAPIPFTLTEKELKLVTDPNASPIIFASTSVNSKKIPDGNEFLATGPLSLGKDIDVAFAPADQVRWFQSQLDQFGVSVYDRDAAFYLEMMSMAKGSQMVPYDSKSLNDPVVFAQTMNADVLPSYGISFPENARYLTEQGKFEPVTDQYLENGKGRQFKNHAAYLHAVKEGTILPRHTHGLMHSFRTALWARALAEIYKIPPEKRFWLGVTAGMHDIQRSDDGVDRWDRESAMRLKAYLISRKLPADQIDEYTHAILHKDPENGQYVSDIQCAVHDADVIEIIRVMSRSQFDPKHLQFFKLPHLTDDYKNKLLNEFFDFIRITENHELRMTMEQTSQDYAGDMMRLLAHLVKQGRFPLLAALVKTDLAAFDPGKLPKNIEAILAKILQSSTAQEKDVKSALG